MSQRLAWPDAARGLTILLVVMLHSTMWVGYLGTSSTVLTWVNTTFASMRMPLFFCIAGIFAEKWIAADWRNLASNKLAILVWVFLAWQPIFFAFKYTTALTLPAQDPSLFGQIARMVASPIRPNGETWFLWALTIYFVLAKSLRTLPSSLHLLLAALVSFLFSGFVRPWLGADTIRFMGAGLEMIAPLYFFFIFGLIFRHKILAISQGSTRPRLIAAFILWISTAGTAAVFDVSRSPGIEFCLQLLGVAAGIALGILFQKLSWLRRIGRNTLPIYVGHMLFVSLGTSIAYMAGCRTQGEGYSVSLSLSLAAVSILASRSLWKCTQGNPIAYLYSPPPWFRQLVQTGRAPGYSKSSQPD